MQTVQQAGWSSLKNGELLRIAPDGFDVFISVDRNLVFHQNLTNLRIALVIIVVRENRIEYFLPVLAELRQVLERILEAPLTRGG